MTKLEIKFVQQFKDRHGKRHRYFRRVGFPRIKLRGEPGSSQFVKAYSEALAASERPQSIETSKAKPGSLRHLADEYLASSDFLQLAESTRYAYKNTLDRLMKIYGELPARTVEGRHIRKIMDSFAGRGGGRL